MSSINDIDVISTKKRLTNSQKVKDILNRGFIDEIAELGYTYPYNNTIVLDYNKIDVLGGIYDDNNRTIGEWLGEKPNDIITLFKKHIAKMVITQNKSLEDVKSHKNKISPEGINVRISDYYGIKLGSVNELKSRYIGKFVNFEGMVKRRHVVRPMMKFVMFECRSCMRLHEVEQNSEQIKEPALCQECGGRSFRMIMEESEFRDRQILIVQEALEKTKGTEIPRSIEVFLDEDLVDTVLPGQKISVTGELKVLKDNAKKDNSQLKFYVDANYLENIGKTHNDVEITPEDQEKILKLSTHPDLLYLMTHSVAPTIYGNTNIKKGMVLHLFGGSEKKFSNMGKRRSSIHILVLGDPSLGKSVLMESINELSMNSIIASGKSTTGAGLTASAVKDEGGAWTLEAGAAIMANDGNLCIDEFDKMRSEDRASLHQIMEQEILTVNKAGINATLNARCAIFAVANPKYSKYDRSKSIGEQINLPASLLSRFDIIFIMEDKINPDIDRKIAEHITQLHQSHNVDYFIEPDLFSKYISYAKQNIKPVISDEVSDILVNYYVDIRGMVENSDEPTPITTRQLEGMIRLTEASAKLHLRQEASIDDAQIAIDMMNDFLKKVGYDPETGKYDIQKLYGAKPKSWYDKVRKTEELLKEHMEMYGEYKEDLFIEEVMLKCYVFENDAKKIIKEATKYDDDA